MQSIENITQDFAFLDDWEERYRYVIELGRELEPLPEALKTDATKVQGCASQVWLVADREDEESDDPILRYRGDSDAHIVRGLVAIVVALYSGKHASEILRTEAEPVFAELGLKEHLTPQRSNGLVSMVERIRQDARGAVAADVA